MAVTEGDSSVPESDRSSGPEQYFGEADSALKAGS